MKKTASLKLLERVLIMPNGCWLYSGPLFPTGYGQFKGLQGQQYAHRAAYILWGGPLAPGMDADHECHNEDAGCAGGPTCPHRRCCNPAHLREASRQENLRSGRGPGARWANAACAHGHLFTPENTRVKKNGCRDCKTCARERRARV